jgi:hypothetical protein
VLLLLRPAASLVVSMFLHSAAATPFLIWMWVWTPTQEMPGEEGETGPIGNDGGEVAEGDTLDPVEVSIYVEPVTATVAPVTALGEPAASTAPAATAAAATQKQGTADGDKNTSMDKETYIAGIKGRRPRGERKPCDPVEEIVQTGDSSWKVERGIVDFYATHLGDLEQQGNVAPHKDAGGKTDGARIYLPRCSVVRQAGLKNGDVIRSVNGRRVTTLPEALAAYFALRTQSNIALDITRKNGGDVTLRYQLVR